MLWLALAITVLVGVVCAFPLWLHRLRLRLHGADALIILGYKTIGRNLHPLLEERLLTALRAWECLSYKKIICSGGAVAGAYSEAGLMQSYLIAHGIDGKCILVEDASTDTVENVLYSAALMGRENLLSAIIISNSFHVRRIRMICHSLGLNYSCYAQQHGLPTMLFQWSQGWNEIKAYFKTKHKLKIYLRGSESTTPIHT